MGSTEAFFAAIEAGDVDRVRSMIAADPSLASARDDLGVSALMRARYRFESDLLDAISTVAPARDVFEAAALGDAEPLRQLLDEDPSLVTTYSADGFSALHFAAFFGQIGTARSLLDRGAGVDAHGRGWMVGTPLSSAAAGGHTDVARLLLDAGADPDARQSSGWTPLHSAAHDGNRAMVELLLGRGADPRATNDDGATVLSMAEESGDEDTAARVRSALGL
jgi:ankyrin repeat protein